MLNLEQREIRALFAKLCKARLHNFPEEKKGVVAPNEQGVYVIYSPRTKRVLHVGRTYKGKSGLRQRLNNHMHGSSSFAQAYLKGRGSLLRNGYTFRCLPVKHRKRRALLEAYAAGQLCPAHIGLGV
jgi:hypothetical protein